MTLRHKTSGHRPRDRGTLETRSTTSDGFPSKAVSFLGTRAQFLDLCADMTVDVIEMEPAVHSGWHLWLDIDRTARPLLVRPAPGAKVIFDNTDGRGVDRFQGLLYLGWKSKCAYITFDGPFRIQNYAILQTGLVATAYADHFTANGFTVRDCSASAGEAATGMGEWVVYVSSDGTHRGNTLTFNDWDFVSDPLGKVAAFTTFHTPQAVGLVARRWRVSGSEVAPCYGAVLEGDGSGFVFDGWSLDYTVRPFMATNDKDRLRPAGVVRNMTSTRSISPPTINAPMLDGGGNSWN